jgi:phosphoenolpyruvate carboxykinase (GTP)
VPRYRDIDFTGMEDFTREHYRKVMPINRELWKQELLLHEDLFSKMYDRLPKEIFFIRQLLLSSLWRSPEKWTEI